MKKILKWGAISIVALIVLITAIAIASGGGSKSTGSPGAVASSPAATRYSSARQVVTALKQGGLACSGGSDNTPVVSGASSETQCNFTSSELVLIDVFPGTVSTATVLSDSVSTGTQQIWSDVGPNWQVQTDGTYVKRVQAILRGRVIAGPWHPAAADQQSSSSSPSTVAPATSAPASPSMTAAQAQAVQAAQSYLSDGQGFSYESLLQQLTSSDGSGFSTSDATFAIGYLKPDWDQQAVDAAKNYLSDGQGFSRDSLIQQLTSSDGNGFTEAQAAYAVAKVGL